MSTPCVPPCWCGYSPRLKRQTVLEEGERERGSLSADEERGPCSFRWLWKGGEHLHWRRRRYCTCACACVRVRGCCRGARGGGGICNGKGQMKRGRGKKRGERNFRQEKLSTATMRREQTIDIVGKQRKEKKQRIG